MSYILLFVIILFRRTACVFLPLSSPVDDSALIGAKQGKLWEDNQYEEMHVYQW